MSYVFYEVCNKVVLSLLFIVEQKTRLSQLEEGISCGLVYLRKCVILRWEASAVSTYCASDEDEVVETASQQPSTSSSRGGKKKKTTADLPLTSQQQPSSIKQEVKQEPPPVLSADAAIQVDDDVALSPPIKTEVWFIYYIGVLYIPIL